MSRYRVHTCRICAAPIVWAVNERTRRAMPVDADPSPRGTVRLIDRGPGLKPAFQVVPYEERGHDDLHTSHFATCPQAGQWRSQRGGADA